MGCGALFCPTGALRVPGGGVGSLQVKSHCLLQKGKLDRTLPELEMEQR